MRRNKALPGRNNGFRQTFSSDVPTRKQNFSSEHTLPKRSMPQQGILKHNDRPTKKKDFAWQTHVPDIFHKNIRQATALSRYAFLQDMRPAMAHRPEPIEIRNIHAGLYSGHHRYREQFVRQCQTMHRQTTARTAAAHTNEVYGRQQDNNILLHKGISTKNKTGETAHNNIPRQPT